MSAEVHSRTQRARTHAALADLSRLAIVDELSVSDRSPTEISVALGLPSNLLAHHLGVLEQAGLIERFESHGDKRRRYLRLRNDALSGLLRPPQLHASRLLFVCTGNSARSQLAAALWNKKHSVAARSAGTHPAERVHPQAVRVGEQLGLELSDARPRSLSSRDLQKALVVTVCDQAHEELVAQSSVPTVHWSIADPAEDGGRRAFRLAADEIERRLDSFAPLVAPVV